MTSMILINTRKTVDTIEPDVLSQKLYAVSFSKRTVNWGKTWISNRVFLDNLGNSFSQTASVSCGIPEASILGEPFVLVCDMSRTAKCDIFHYVDDSCLVCQHKTFNKIEKQLYEDFLAIFKTRLSGFAKFGGFAGFRVFDRFGGVSGFLFWFGVISVYSPFKSRAIFSVRWTLSILLVIFSVHIWQKVI